MMDGNELLLAATHWSSDRTWAVVLGVLAAVVSLALIIVSWTRWGQTKSLTKCVVLAVLAHIWLLMYAYGTRVIVPGDGSGNGGGQQSFHVEFVPDEDEAAPSLEADSQLTPPDLIAEALQAPTLLEVPEPIEEPKQEVIEEKPPTVAVEEPSLPASEPVYPTLPQPDLVAKEMPTVQVLDQAAGLHEPILPKESVTAMPMVPLQHAPPTTAVPLTRQADQRPLPEIYKNRWQQRASIAYQNGGDANTEAAVEAALQWLAQSQSPNGSWNAAQFGAGRETKTLGMDRAGTGKDSDTGMTGLALLAFMGAGYTHLQGPYAQTISQGIHYLRNEQLPSGDLAGRKQMGADKSIHYARMYCHGMASFALAEAYAMTGDPMLIDCVRDAAKHTLACQNERTGGWRYSAREVVQGDPGDLSQFGWQAMMLHSAELGGLPMPASLQPRFKKFLDSVSAGAAGGLATYRPQFVPGQKPSPAMTAEAMACRALLQIPAGFQADNEAKKYLLEHLPGQSEENLYYWYYATLAMFQSHDQAWETWNVALKKHLVTTQRMDSASERGSWDPNCVWAGYGGRVYSTSMACMCLEVYYRYLPLYRMEPTSPAMGLPGAQPNSAWGIPGKGIQR